MYHCKVTRKGYNWTCAQQAFLLIIITMPLGRFGHALLGPRGLILHVVGMLPTPFFYYSVLVSVSVSMALSTVFHSIKSPDNSLLSHSVLLVLFLPFLCGSFNYLSLYESLLQP